MPNKPNHHSRRAINTKSANKADTRSAQEKREAHQKRRQKITLSQRRPTDRLTGGQTDLKMNLSP